MAEVSIRELRNHGGEVLERVERGERIVIARSGRPVALLTGLDTLAPQPRVPGHEPIVIGPDFDLPLPEFDELSKKLLPTVSGDQLKLELNEANGGIAALTTIAGPLTQALGKATAAKQP